MLARNAYGETVEIDPSGLSLFKSLGLVLLDGSDIPAGVDETTVIRGWKPSEAIRASQLAIVYDASTSSTTVEEVLATAESNSVELTEEEAKDILFAVGANALT